MSGGIVETFGDEWPRFTIVVSVPDDVWRQHGTDKPGYAEFAVYEVAMLTDDGAPMYGMPDSVSTVEGATTDLAKAERTAYGTVKWDGCVNYEIGLVDHTFDVMLHACDADGLRVFFGAIQRAYEVAARLVGVADSPTEPV